jgi:hydrogenase-4 component F
MGLAPMHTWLPDAHGEAPAPVSAMLSGALLPCAFLAILRIYHLCLAAGEGDFARRLLIIVGLASMGVTAIFVMRQRDLKRLLAYSSIEQMGLLAIGIGIGGSALFGTMLHLLNNGLTKALLFLSVGNIYHAYGSKSTMQVRGVLRVLPYTGAIFLAGFFALAGSPPFGPFISLFSIVQAVFTDGWFFVGVALLMLLLLVFMGMGTTIFAAVQGRGPAETHTVHARESMLTRVPMVILMGLVFILGVYIPGPVRTLLQDAVHFLEARP